MEKNTNKTEPARESAGLRFLYGTYVGRMILKLLIRPSVSCICGRFMDSRISTALIPGFIRKNGIDLSEYEQEEYRCFNDCFCRHIRPEQRPVDPDPAHMTAPSDGLLSVFRVQKDTVIPVKQSAYTLGELLRDDALATEFEDGYCLVYRLCVHHYHRYAYVETGIKGENIHIPGVFHTVRPIALKAVKVFCENFREYTVLETRNFGKIVQMEVGAMLVGRIRNFQEAGPTVRGKEKGTFLYGGSTVIVLVQKDRIRIETHEEEIPVKLGQQVAVRY